MVRTRPGGGPFFPKQKRLKSPGQAAQAPAFGSRGLIRQARRRWLPRVRFVRCRSWHFTATLPAFEPVQPRADGLKDHPALKAVGGVVRQQEAAVSARGAVQETPEGHAALQPGQLAGEVADALL